MAAALALFAAAMLQLLWALAPRWRISSARLRWQQRRLHRMRPVRAARSRPSWGARLVPLGAGMALAGWAAGRQDAGLMWCVVRAHAACMAASAVQASERGVSRGCVHRPACVVQDGGGGRTVRGGADAVQAQASPSGADFCTGFRPAPLADLDAPPQNSPVRHQQHRLYKAHVLRIASIMSVRF